MLGEATSVANLENPVIATEEEEEEEPELDMMQKRLEVRRASGNNGVPLGEFVTYTQCLNTGFERIIMYYGMITWYFFEIINHSMLM